MIRSKTDGIPVIRRTERNRRPRAAATAHRPIRGPPRSLDAYPNYRMTRGRGPGRTNVNAPARLPGSGPKGLQREDSRKWVESLSM